MKFRNDFVTNSSSSSYVIVINKDATMEDVKTFVDKGIQRISDDFPGVLNERDQYIEFVTDALSDPLLECNDMKISFGQAYDDDVSGIVTNFPSTDKIHVKQTYD